MQERGEAGPEMWTETGDLTDGDSVVDGGALVVKDRLLRRRSMDKALSLAATRLIGAGDLDSGIEEAIGLVGRACCAERAHLFQFNSDLSRFSCTHEWCCQDVSPVMSRIRDLPVPPFDWGLKRLQAGEVLTISDVSDLPAEATAERRICQELGVESLVVLPVVVVGKLSGFVGFGNLCEAQRWTMAHADVQNVLGKIIGGVLGQRQMQNSLQRSETLLRTIIESSEDCIFLLDRDRNCLYANRMGSEFSESGSGSSAAAGLKSVFRDISQLVEDWKERVETVFQTGLPLKGEEGKSYSQREFFSRWSLSPVRDSQGKVDAVCLVFRDITQERTMESQLRQAQKMEALGKLAGGVAHDFNNQLMVIQGCAEGLRGELPLSSKLRQDLQDLTEATQKAGRLTRQLLTLSSSQRLKLELVQPNRLLNEVAKAVGHLLPKSVALKLKFLARPVAVEGDLAQLERVLVNLALNARDAMPKGGQLSLETDLVELNGFDRQLFDDPRGFQPGSYVLLAVGDTGTGIAPEIRGHIFEPFFTTKGDKGTGLGLATVYGIVKQHQGLVNVRSEPGGGTTFNIYLAAKDQHT
jgi:PAS domain S-box-containing protein